jgi:hypothetical protein
MNEILLDPEYTYIIGVLLAIGAVLKHALPTFPNRFIPLVTLVAGTVAVCWWAEAWDKHTILAGIIVALTATGFHSATKSLSGKEL